SLDLLCAGGVLYAVCVVFIWPHVRYLPAVLSRAKRGPHLPHAGRLAAVVCGVVCTAPHGGFCRSVPALHPAGLPGAGDYCGAVGYGGPGLSPPVCRCHAGVLSGHCQPDHAGAAGGAGHWPDVSTDWAATGLVHLGAGGATDLDTAFWAAHHVCS